MDIYRIPAGANCYIVKHNKKIMMVDPGEKGTLEVVLKSMERLQIFPSKIDYILLTHCHRDHFYNTSYFQQKYGTKTAISKQDYLRLKTHETLTINYADGPVGALIKSASMKTINEYQDNMFKADILLSPETNYNFGMDERIYFLPGHTKGSIGVLFGSGEFIAGDIFMNLNYPRRAYVGEDREKTISSANIVKNLPVTMIYPGHGKPFPLGKLKSKK